MRFAPYMYMRFHILLKNIDDGYSLELTRRGDYERVPTIYVLSKNKKNVKIFQLKNLNFKSSKIYVAWASLRNANLARGLGSCGSLSILLKKC